MYEHYTSCTVTDGSVADVLASYVYNRAHIEWIRSSSAHSVGVPRAAVCHIRPDGYLLALKGRHHSVGGLHALISL